MYCYDSVLLVRRNICQAAIIVYKYVAGFCSNDSRYIHLTHQLSQDIPHIETFDKNNHALFGNQFKIS